MKKSGQLVIGLAVAALAVAYTVRNISTRDLLESFTRIELQYLALTTLLMVATYWARAFRWQALISPVKEVRIRDLLSPLMVGFMAAVLPARAGEFVRAYLLGKSQSIPFASSFATIVIERLFDMLMLLIMLTWVLMFRGKIFESGASWNGITIGDLAFQFGLLSLVLVSTLIAFIYLLTFKRDLAMDLVTWFLKPLPEKWQEKILSLVSSFGEGLDVVRNPRALIKISLSTVLVWTLIVLAYYPLYFAYDLNDTSITSPILLTLMICILITLLPTPAFLGSFNAGVLIALHEIMHEAELAAVSFGFVAWGLNMLVVMIGGVYFILHDHISLRKLAEIDPEAEDTGPKNS